MTAPNDISDFRSWWRDFRRAEGACRRASLVWGNTASIRTYVYHLESGQRSTLTWRCGHNNTARALEP